MKLLPFSLIILMSLAVTAMGQNIGFNDDNSAPKASAMVDVFSASKGLLIPRIALTSTSTAAPVTSPETSLLIYNTATTGDVTPGYYYWATKWVRLTASSDPKTIYGITTKTSNATLLKTENLVMASGDITLTLPTVTSVDDGLEIVVKNIGTYTDLITINPQSGKTIDGISNSKLTRWQGKTYIATGTNWIVKDKNIRTDNDFEVSASGSFTTIPEVIAFLNKHIAGPSVVEIGGGTYVLAATQTINFAYPVTFKGLSFGETLINCPSNDTAFNAKTECYFKMLSLFAGATPGIGILLSGTAQYYEIKDSYFFGFSNAIKTSGNEDVWVFETDFENCTVSGVEIASGTSDVTFKMSECDFTNCAKGINLLSYGTGTEVSVLSGTFYNSTGQTGIVYVPSAISPYYSSIIIQDNSFNSTGTFASGFDFTNARDADIFIENNAGVPSERPHCKINVTNSTATTSLTATTWFRLVAFTGGTVTTDATKWTILGNRITYQPVNIRDGIAFISGNITCTYSGGGAKTLNLAIVKNTVTSPASNPIRFGETTIRISATTVSAQFSTNVYLPNVVQGDYFEIWVNITSSSGSPTVIMEDMNWYTDTH